MANNDKDLIKKIEAEVNNEKPAVLSSKRSAFINSKARSSGGCVTDCGIILSGGRLGSLSHYHNLPTGNPPYAGFFHYNHDTNTYTPLLNSNGSFIGWRQDVARWGDKLYAKFGGLYNPGGISQGMIQEYQINQDCTVTEIRNIVVTGGGPNIGHGMDMIDANTIVCGSAPGALIGAQHGVQYLLEIDISGNCTPFTAGYIPPFGYVNLPTPNTVTCPATPGLIISSNTIHAANVPPSLQGFWGGYKAVDIIYFEDTGRYLVSMVGLNSLSVHFPSLPNKVLRLFSSSGQLLEECPNPGSGLGLYRKCDEVFVTGTNDDIHPVTFGPLTVNPAIQNSGLITNGAAYNSLEYSSAGSKCCAPIVTSTSCYDIGDIGPEGGIIFAVPLGHPQNNGVNQTPYYYEVAQSDIDIAGTPDNGFNLTCGDPIEIKIIVDTSANLSSGVNNDSILFGYGPGSLNTNFNPADISIGDLVNAVDAQGNNLFPLGSTPTVTNITTYPASTAPNPTFTTCFVEFNIPMIGPFQSQPAHEVTFTTTTSTSGWSVVGSEWGVHNKPIVVLDDFGSGLDNTDLIHSHPWIYPQGHPWLDTHDIAATKCLQQPTQSGTDDWFLPSKQEFKEIITNVGPNSSALNTVTLNSNSGFSENLYWTSSNRIPPGYTNMNHKYAWAYDADIDNFVLSYRCHVLSVRPIRRFECEPEPPPPPPCSGPNCIEYNYRNGWYSLHGGAGQSANESPYTGTPPPQYNIVDWYATPEFTNNFSAFPYIQNYVTNPNYWGDSVIGTPVIQLACNGLDVIGNRYSNTDFSNAAGGEFFITMWDAYYNYMGKWRYELDSVITNPTFQIAGQTITYSGWEPDPTNPSVPSESHVLELKNGSHVDGPYPIIAYFNEPGGGGGASSGCFIKLEWSGALNFENGSNANVFGGQQPWLYGNHWENGGTNIGGVANNTTFTVGMGNYPAYCGIGHSQLAQNAPFPTYNWLHQSNNIFTRYATFPPVDENGNVLTVHPDIYTAGMPTWSENTVFTPWHAYYNGSLGSYVGVEWMNLCSGGTLIANHCWSICGAFYNGTWYSVPDPWFGGAPYGPIAMENNPLGTTSPPFSSNPYTDQDFTDFYDWIITQEPTLTVGDTFMFHTPGMSMQINFIDNNGNVITGLPIQILCFKYRGIQTYSVPLGIVNNNFPLPTVFHNPSASCCVSSGSSSSLIRPAENNPDSIKLKFDTGVLSNKQSKRQSFTEAKQLKNTGPFGLFGYYPLYENIDDAIKNSPEDSYHIHDFGGQEYYMPNGLEMGKTQFHGDWEPMAITTNTKNEDFDEILPPTSLLPFTTNYPPSTLPFDLTPKTPEVYTPPPPSSSPTPPPTPPPSSESKEEGY